MTNKKATLLTGNLISRKGEATPSTVFLKDSESIDIVMGTKSAQSKKNGTIAVTVRLDPSRYEKLKLYGVHNRKTNQEIMVDALDKFLNSKLTE